MLGLRRRGRTFLVAAIVGLSLLFVSCLTPPVQAADFNLTVSPLPIDLSVKPGGTVGTPLRVENSGSQAVRVKVSLLKFKANGLSGNPQIIEPSPTDPSLSWVHFSETSFQAEPNVWHTITMTIKPPADAAFGYYYAVVFSEDSPGQQLTIAGQHNNIKGAVASLVLLDVNAPGEKRNLSVKSYISDHTIYEFLPAQFSITVHNGGNTHVVPSGDIFISRNHKTDIAHVVVNSQGGNVLPGTDRTFKLSWDDGFPRYQSKQLNGQVIADKNGRPQEILSWGSPNLSKLRFGHYYAHLVLTYNDGTRDIPVEGDVSFWVIPWRLIIAAILALSLPALVVYLFMRRRNKHKYEKRA